MKTKPIIVILLSCFAIGTGAQSFNSADTYDSTASSWIPNFTITLPWTDRQAVSISGNRICVHDYQYFTPLTNSIPPGTPAPPMPFTMVDVPNAFTIKDAKIVDTLLFFCGRYDDSRRQGGLIGSVPLRTASGMNYINYNVIENLYSLERMVVRNVPGQLSVFAIGRQSSSSWESDILVQQSSNLPSSPTIFINLPIGEVADDIFLVDDTIITVGRAGSNLCLRKGSAASLFSTSSTISTRYSYPANFNGDVYSTIMKGDTLAVAYVTNMADTGFAATLRKIKLATMNNFYSTQIPLDNKSEPLALARDERTNMLLLLQPNVDTLGEMYTNVYHIQPPNASGTTNYTRFRHNDRWYTSAACVKSRTLTGNIVSQSVLLYTEGSRWYWYHEYYNSMGLGSAFYCTPGIFRSAAAIPNLRRAVSTMSFRLFPLPPIINWTWLVPWNLKYSAVQCYRYQ